MELPKDPFILLSLINTKLRDFYPNLEDLCKSLFIEKEELFRSLSAVGYQYSESRNQFISA
ncbi:MAG: DUF4250 domain-containing protein [Oscillospiraceae bacterium]